MSSTPARPSMPSLDTPPPTTDVEPAGDFLIRLASITEEAFIRFPDATTKIVSDLNILRPLLNPAHPATEDENDSDGYEDFPPLPTIKEVDSTATTPATSPASRPRTRSRSKRPKKPTKSATKSKRKTPNVAKATSSPSSKPPTPATNPATAAAKTKGVTVAPTIEVPSTSKPNPKPAKAIETPSASKPAATSTESQVKPPQRFTYRVLNIPGAYDTQRKFYQLVNTQELFKGVIVNLKFVPKDQLAYLEASKTLNVKDTSRALQDRTGDPAIVIEPINSRQRSAKKSQPDTKSPYHLVICDVDTTITTEELGLSLVEIDFPFNSIHRIVSKRFNKPTRMVRMFLDAEEYYTDALINGICIDGLIRPCEAPHKLNIIKPTAKYCSRCCQSGHEISECRTRQTTCPNCGSGEHKSADCPNLKNPKCPNCKGTHPAWSPRCPKRQETPSSHQEAKPLTTERIIPPATLTADVRLWIQFTTTLLMNILPDRRETIARYSSDLSGKMFGHSIVPTARNNKVEMTFVPIQ
ncbi:unnamed protein product [Diabrotica balteata]|uniref:CCHC-type domain-containing protein n=1 Tax=Diabrotica balteata TaxID=107213 RepID=A0A9N9X6Y2_DIABA|nr:unnamed protein product [Diabrotica balteata]